jgi:hypothetical protein
MGQVWTSLLSLKGNWLLEHWFAHTQFNSMRLAKSKFAKP